MTLPWVRLDTAFPTNPKILGLIADKKHPAVVMYVAGLAYAGAQGTDGFIPATALPFIHGNKKQATECVHAGLWKPCRGGWDINGWHEFQASSDEHRDRRTKAQAAANLRWERQRAREAAEAAMKEADIPTPIDPPDDDPPFR